MTRQRQASAKACGIRFKVHEERQPWLFNDLVGLSSGVRSQRCIELMLMGKFFEQLATGRAGIAALAHAAASIGSASNETESSQHSSGADPVGNFVGEMLAGLPGS